jgi:hypothetical protein
MHAAILYIERAAIHHFAFATATGDAVPQTLAQKLVARAAGRSPVEPDEITCRVDRVTRSRGCGCAAQTPQHTASALLFAPE